MSSKNTLLTYVRHGSLLELGNTWLDLGTYIPLNYAAPEQRCTDSGLNLNPVFRAVPPPPINRRDLWHRDSHLASWIFRDPRYLPNSHQGFICTSPRPQRRPRIFLITKILIPPCASLLHIICPYLPTIPSFCTGSDVSEQEANRRNNNGAHS